MTNRRIDVFSSENGSLESFLDDRLYEFNVGATGISDGRSLWASMLDDDGSILAAISGHTWGGCCEIVRLWVHPSQRGKGLGTSLLEAAEREALKRDCTQIVLSTHSFQAPAFYEQLGFCRLVSIPNYPEGYENIIYVKDLDCSSGA